MLVKEKVLYHQIHPVKLFTDIVSAIIALYLFWQREWLWAIAVLFLPAIIVSFVLIQFTNLENYRNSKVGRYVKKYMTVFWQVARLVGMLVMVVGAWYQYWDFIGMGFGLIVIAWTRGLILP